MKKLLVFSLLSLLASTQAYADCGSPPDPWGNASAYASWCSCMGGSYDYQTTACTGVSSGSGSSSSSSYSEGSSGNWFCLAKSRKGACGYGYDYGTESAARNRALSECYKYSKSCYITYCNTHRPSGDPCKYSGGTSSSSSSSNSSSQSTNSQYQNPSASFNTQSDDTQLAPSPFRPLTNTLLNKTKQKKTKLMSWPTKDWTCTQCDAALVNRISSRFGMVNNIFFYDWVYGNFGKFYECAGRTPAKQCPKGDDIVLRIKNGCKKQSLIPEGYEKCVQHIIDHS